MRGGLPSGAEVVEPRLSSAGLWPGSSKGKSMTALRLPPLAASDSCGQLPDVAEDDLEAPPRAAPEDLVLEEQVVAVLDAELLEQQLAHLAPPVARVVHRLGVGEDALGVDAGQLQRDRSGRPPRRP